MIYLTPVGWAQLSALFKWVGKKFNRWFEQETERLNYFDVPAPYAPMFKIGVPQERAAVVPKDVWAELQAMPNDGSWSTRQLVRAIQRANKKKGGKS